MGLRMWVAMAIAYAGRSLVLWWMTFCVGWQSHGIGLAGREWADLKGLSLVFKLLVVACSPGLVHTVCPETEWSILSSLEKCCLYGTFLR